eukprot:GHVS01103322.1.p2 GENE.GHVS01103322.1~~GHVS01103322.1.p2  ORF type:complete len:127 (+),score=15.91 GHVS01103322.1:133-513(+)
MSLSCVLLLLLHFAYYIFLSLPSPHPQLPASEWILFCFSLITNTSLLLLSSTEFFPFIMSKILLPSQIVSDCSSAIVYYTDVFYTYIHEEVGLPWFIVILLVLSIFIISKLDPLIRSKRLDDPTVF